MSMSNFKNCFQGPISRICCVRCAVSGKRTQIESENCIWVCTMCELFVWGIEKAWQHFLHHGSCTNEMNFLLHLWISFQLMCINSAMQIVAWLKWRSLLWECAKVLQIYIFMQTFPLNVKMKIQIKILFQHCLRDVTSCRYIYFLVRG